MNLSCAKNREVVIVQYRLTHYRIRFYEILRKLLKEKEVKLRVVYSPPGHETDRGELVKTLFSDLPWGERVPSSVLPFGFTWQPLVKRTINADLVIVSDGTKHILNYAFYFLPFFKRPKVAFWGHGWNHQTDKPESWSERVKSWLGKRTDWYFAYTWHVRDMLIKRGYDGNRITDIQNAVEGPRVTINPREIQRLREELHLSRDSHVALFCGKMYPMKQLHLLIDAAKRAHAELSSLVLILAGAGSDQWIAEEAAQKHQFVHYVGPALEEKKAALYAVSSIAVMPGAVGLGIVDAFHHGIPPVATNLPYHGPEFVYLRDGENGLVADNSAEALSDAIVRLATDKDLYRRLIEGVEVASRTYTVEEMAHRFAAGVLAALRAEPKGSDVSRIGTQASPPNRAE